MQKVVLATGNAGKVRELASLLNDFGLDVVAQTDLGVDSAEETGLTFIENAILKARHAAQITGLPAIADDSGLAVDALAARRGSTPRAIPALTPPTSRIWKSCLSP
jgi:XTP/dITP diphosphohydrolase